MRSPTSRVHTWRALTCVSRRLSDAPPRPRTEKRPGARVLALMLPPRSRAVSLLSLRLRRVPRVPAAPDAAPPAPAPRHRAHQRPAAAGVRPGGAQAEAVAVLAHLQQAHPVQEVSAGRPAAGQGGRAEARCVSSVPGPRTVWGTLCRRPRSRTSEGRRARARLRSSEMQPPPWKWGGGDDSALTDTRAPCGLCEAAETWGPATCSNVNAEHR